MDLSFKAYRMSMKHIIDRNYDNIFQFLNPVNLYRLFRTITGWLQDILKAKFSVSLSLFRTFM
jgi:hypothetical protein